MNFLGEDGGMMKLWIFWGEGRPSLNWTIFVSYFYTF